MKYIRTKNGKIYAFYDTKEIDNVVIGYVDERDKNALDGGSYFGKEDIRIADTIEELIQEGDLVVLFSCKLILSTILHMTIIYGDAKRLGFVFDKDDIDELYIKQSNGDWKLVAKKRKRKLELWRQKE